MGLLENTAGFLVLSILLPLVGAGLLWVVAPLGRSGVRWVALAISLLTLFVVGCVVFSDESRSGAEFAVWDAPWVSDAVSTNLDIRFSVGLDGVGLWLYGLSALLVVTAILVSWDAIEDRPTLFYGMLLLLEFGCLGVFAARDLILFYVFFEFTLIPLFFLIGIWGSEERRYAAIKFFLFTLAGSVLTFLGLLSIVLWHAYHVNNGVLSFSIPRLAADLQAHAIPNDGPHGYLQTWIFLALLAGFAIKVPLFPLHTWLPLAHVQAPTAGSVLLAGVLLKVGTYGMLRFSIPLLPDASASAMPYLLGLAVIGILYGGLVALAQSDLKRLIAYSSVSHLGFCVLGLFALNQLGIRGGMLQMINHGISTGALFAIVGMLYERFHTREIRELGGLARSVPWLAFFMLLFTLSSIGLPGLNGFAGEFMILLGMFQRAWSASLPAGQNQLLVIAVLAVSGVVLGAWYMLWLVQRVFFGPLHEPHHEPSGAGETVCDLKPREFVALAPLAVLVIWIGLYPGFFLDRMSQPLDQITEVAENALKRSYTTDEPVARRPFSERLTSAR